MFRKDSKIVGNLEQYLEEDECELIGSFLIYI